MNAGDKATSPARGRGGRCILIVGAVPPPFVGPFLAMERLLAARVLHEQFHIIFLDISDHRDTTNIGRLDRHNVWLGIKHALRGLWLMATRRPQCVYVAVSQGIWGYLRDLCYMVPAIVLRRKVVVHLRGSEFDQFYESLPGPLRALSRAVFRRVSRCIVLGESLKRVMSGLVEPDRIRVVPNGIAWQRFGRPPGAVRRSEKGKRILFLAHLMRRKGTHETARAFALVRQKHPDASLTFAGGFWSSVEREELHSLVDGLGVAGSVQFMGIVSGEAKTQALHDHDVFVFPPIQPEGLPWVILEAMSASLPVVSSNQGAIAEVVQNGLTGYIVPAAPEAIAEKLCLLLENSGLRKRMGESGLHRVQSLLSEEAYLSRLVAIFQEVVACSPHVGMCRSLDKAPEEC